MSPTDLPFAVALALTTGLFAIVAGAVAVRLLFCGWSDEILGRDSDYASDSVAWKFVSAASLFALFGTCTITLIVWMVASGIKPR